MRHTFKKAALAALIVTSGINAAAAESVQVNVIGTIIPAACTPSLAGGGVVNYGNIRADSLNVDSFTLLREMGLDFAIDCEAPARVAVRAINDRPGTLAGATESANGNGKPQVSLLGFAAGDAYASGLGLDGTTPIGGYSLAINRVSADNNNVISLKASTANNNTKWTSLNSFGHLLEGGPKFISWASPETTTPVAFEHLTGNLRVQAYINQASELDLSHAIHLDGQTTLEVVYL